MNELTDMNEIEAAKLIKDNYTKLYKIAGEVAQCPMDTTKEVSWVNNQHIWPNRIYGLNVSEVNIDNMLEWITDGMKSGKLPEILTTSLFTMPKNYENYFSKHGIEKKFDAQGMVLSLDMFDEDEKYAQIDLTINKVTVTTNNGELNDELALWCNVVLKALFDQSESYFNAYYNVISKLLDMNIIQCFVAYVNEQPVATSMLYISENNIGGIYHVSTLKEYRGLGIGKEITKAALIYAKENSCKLSVLFASELGEAVYRKLGFKTYCSFGRYGLKK